MEVVAEGGAEAVVAVGEGVGFLCFLVAAAFVPGYESVADVDDVHGEGAGALLGGPLFCGVKEGAAQACGLERGGDAEGAEVPGFGRFGLEEDAALEVSGGVVAAEKEEGGVGFGGEFFAQEGFCGAVALDEVAFGVPSGAGAGAAEGGVHKGDDGWDVGGGGRF